MKLVSSQPRQPGVLREVRVAPRPRISSATDLRDHIDENGAVDVSASLERPGQAMSLFGVYAVRSRGQNTLVWSSSCAASLSVSVTEGLLVSPLLRRNATHGTTSTPP